MTFNGLHQDTYSISYQAYSKQESARSAYVKIKLGSANAMLKPTLSPGINFVMSLVCQNTFF